MLRVMRGGYSCAINHEMDRCGSTKPQAPTSVGAKVGWRGIVRRLTGVLPNGSAWMGRMGRIGRMRHIPAFLVTRHGHNPQPGRLCYDVRDWATGSDVGGDDFGLA